MGQQPIPRWQRTLHKIGANLVDSIRNIFGNEAAVAMGLASVAGGALSKYNTTVLLAPDEASGAMKKAKKVPYTAPK